MVAGIGSSCETRIMYINSLSYGNIISNSGNLAGFPASNAITSNRGQLWVTAGNFKIDSSNQYLYLGINSIPYIIDLTIGNYTGSTLASHIQSRILAITGITVSCSYSSAYKFTFTCSTNDILFGLSAQTNSIWYDLGLLGTIDINMPQSTTLTGYVRIHTHEFIYFDLGYAMDISFFAILPQRNYANMLTAGATINIKASNINDITTAPLNINVPSGSEGSFYFLEQGYPISYRYVWLTIIDPENPYGPNLEFSQIFLGGYISLPNRTVDAGFTIQDVDRSLRTESQAGGLYFERYGRHKRISNLKFSNLTKIEVAAIQQLYFDLGKSNSYYISIDSGNFYNDLEQFTYFGIFENDPTITSKQAGFFDANFEFRSN